MHLPDQKAHVHMRLQEMFEEKQFGNRCMCDASRRRDTAGLKQICRVIIL